MVYALCSQELLAFAAQMRQPNLHTLTLSSHILLAISLYWLRRHPTYQQMVVERQHSTSFWHRSVRRMIDVLDRNIVDHLIPPLAANAPSSTFFDRVKIIVEHDIRSPSQEPVPIKGLSQVEPDEGSVEVSIRMRLHPSHHQRIGQLPWWRTRHAHHQNGLAWSGVKRCTDHG